MFCGTQSIIVRVSIEYDTFSNNRGVEASETLWPCWSWFDRKASNDGVSYLRVRCAHGHIWLILDEIETMRKIYFLTSGMLAFQHASVNLCARWCCNCCAHCAHNKTRLNVDVRVNTHFHTETCVAIIEEWCINCHKYFSLWPNCLSQALIRRILWNSGLEVVNHFEVYNLEVCNVTFKLHSNNIQMTFKLLSSDLPLMTFKELSEYFQSTFK